MPDYRLSDHRPHPVDRRSFPWTVGGGFGGMALSALLAEEQRAVAGQDRSAGEELG